VSEISDIVGFLRAQPAVVDFAHRIAVVEQKMPKNSVSATVRCVYNLVVRSGYHGFCRRPWIPPCWCTRSTCAIYRPHSSIGCRCNPSIGCRCNSSIGCRCNSRCGGGRLVLASHHMSTSITPLGRLDVGCLIYWGLTFPILPLSSVSCRAILPLSSVSCRGTHPRASTLGVHRWPRCKLLCAICCSLTRAASPVLVAQAVLAVVLVVLAARRHASTRPCRGKVP
jgi:hypothetical protein